MIEVQLPSSKCRKCPLFPRIRHHVPARKTAGAVLAFVGEAPGRDEVTSHLPFVGYAGKLLQFLAKKAGIDWYEITVSNILKCNPEGNHLPEGLELEIAIDCCSEILREDLRGVRVIVGLGAVPLYAMTKKSGIIVHRGSVYELSPGRFYIPTVHPSALRRARFVRQEKNKKLTIPPREVIIADLVRAKKIADDIHFTLPKPEILTHPTPEEQRRFLKMLQDPEVEIGVDIETTREDKTECVVPLIIAFATMDLAIVADFEEDLDFIAEALESPAKKIMHNGQIFDIYVMENVGFKVNNYEFDTMYAHHTVYAELQHKLAFVQSLHSYLPYHKDMKEDIVGEEWEK